MKFTVIDCEQRSPAWRQARAGRVTSSRVSDMLASLKPDKHGHVKGEAAGRRNYRVQLMLERITGQCQERHEFDFVSRAMQDGIDRESYAACLYEGLTGCIIQHTGFLQHTELMCGASLDGHLGDLATPEGIVEIKSPLPATHLEYLTTGLIPDEYEKQAIHQLFVSGAPWCDFVSFNPTFPEKLRLKIVRLHATEQMLLSYQLALTLFLAEVDREVARVQALLEKAA